MSDVVHSSRRRRVDVTVRDAAPERQEFPRCQPDFPPGAVEGNSTGLDEVHLKIKVGMSGCVA
nr:hypothetical protein [Phytoactinopolyspora limicola]